ncbi:maltokinase N-terminal cap-like domain-containing protein [Nocardia sp. NBC_01388]|uniref:maltokinase N-terminal cap-like domain-containing protein n=1 Tax=Nocardia sp. NBC_01388 TaxID=2903596 RepID=UPI00324C0229
MAIVHRTTMVPGKLELLAAWLPTRAWYTGGSQPRLAKAGGFRLDDPAGAVGIEVMVVSDSSGARPVTYLVPMTYRGAPLPDAADALIGTSEHGVLGTRWLYDATHDPVFVEQIVRLLAAQAQPQAQSESDTTDPTVTVRAAEIPVPAAGFGGSSVLDAARWTDITPAGTEVPVLRLHRILGDELPADLYAWVEAPWSSPDGEISRGVFVSTQAG